MFLEILLFLFLGILAGIIVGLIPGLHPNTIFAISLSLLPFLLELPFQFALTFIVALSVSNTFVNFIPSLILGAPEDDGALSVLPGHRMLMAGRGHEAVFLTVVGGLGVILLTVVTLPLIMFAIPMIYTNINSYIHVLLIIIFLWMVYIEHGRKKISAAMIFFLSGLFGLIVLNTLPSQYSLFPALTGLFGVSTLVISIQTRSKIPPQKHTREIKTPYIKGSVVGWVAGLIVGLLPGIGSAQAGVLASQVLKAKTRDFLTALGGINTANIIFTFIVFFTLGKTRSGAAFTISQIIPDIMTADIILIVAVGISAAFVSAIATLKINKFFLGRIENISYPKINKTVIAILGILVLLFAGPLGLLITVTGTFIGLSAILFGVKRTHMMGFLMLPTIFFYAGIPVSFL